ncbi:MAG: hypothetical protein IPI34_14370 [bacterium]|nr:hypothetical protein [bacterium]
MSGAGRRLRQAALPLLLAALTAGLGLPALRVFFSLDDHLFLERAAGLVPWDEGWRRLLSVRLFFGAAWRLFGDDAVGYHAVVLAIHALNGWLVARLARRLGLGGSAAAAAGLAFVASPAAFTVLHWISCVQEALLACGALLATLLVLDGRLLAALAASAAMLLCKESGALLLPALALVLPMTRRRRLLLGAGGAAVAAVLLAATGAFAPRAAGNPYETAYGPNILANLFTYLAWLGRPWDWYPDRAAVPAPQLWPWGLVPVAAAIAVAWGSPARRRALSRGALVFLALLAPVLPLVRHSYLYYLYLPLVPVWILAAAALDAAPGRLRRAVWILPVCLALLSGWQGHQRRTATIAQGVLADPVLRYAASARSMIADLRAAGAAGDLLVLGPSVSRSVDLVGAGGVAGAAERGVFLLAGRALDDGRSVPLFLPQVTSADLTVDIGATTAWRDRKLYLTRGEGQLHFLGDGPDGRRKLSAYFFRSGDLVRARREVLALLALAPDDPFLVGDLGAVALAQGRAAEADSILSRLDVLVGREASPGGAAASRDDLARRIAAERGRAPGAR